MQKYERQKKRYGIHQQTIKTFDKINRKCLQDSLSVVDQSEYEFSYKKITKYVDESKYESFSKSTKKTSFFTNIETQKLELRTQNENCSVLFTLRRELLCSLFTLR